MYFSEAFGIPEDANREWFDPILERDTLLFVDPFSMFADAEESWRQAHDTVIDYFHDAFEVLAKSGLRKSHQYYKRTLTLMEFPEPKEFRLGFAQKTKDGSGSGPGLAKLIVEAMSQAIKRGLADIQHFEELGILVEGINRDRISDVTCNLLKPRLIQYTQDICNQVGVPMYNATVKHSNFNKMRMRWEDAEHLVPLDPASGDPVLLVPWRFLGELPKINEFDFEDTALRDDLNLNISSNVKKSEIVRLARKNPEVVRRWIERIESSSPTPYDVINDPKLIVNWQKVGRNAINAEPLTSETQINSEADLLMFVHVLVAKFRHWAEDMGGWRVFWDSNSKAVPEPNMQLLFLAVLDGYCEMAGLRLDREVETGRGPVDFTITADKRVRVLVEIKKLTHGEFWNGLHVQTPIYMNGQNVSHAIFLTVRDSKTAAMEDRWLKLDEEAAKVSDETGMQIEIERIDILPKASGSKAKRRD